LDDCSAEWPGDILRLVFDAIPVMSGCGEILGRYQSWRDSKDTKGK
jgi:hypothetical protein